MSAGPVSLARSTHLALDGHRGVRPSAERPPRRAVPNRAVPWHRRVAVLEEDYLGRLILDRARCPRSIASHQEAALLQDWDRGSVLSRGEG